MNYELVVGQMDSYRLNACKLPTLHYRRVIGDITETYKIRHCKYYTEAMPNLARATLA